MNCTPHGVATGETDLEGQKSEVVTTGEIDLEAREEITGRVVSAWRELREWGRLLWWKEERGASVVLEEMRRLMSKSNDKYTRLCELPSDYCCGVMELRSLRRLSDGEPR